MSLSLRELKEYLKNKGGYSIEPNHNQLKDLRDLVDDMMEQRSGTPPSTGSGSYSGITCIGHTPVGDYNLSLGDINTLDIKGCSCNEVNDTTGYCTGRTYTPTCICDVDTYCNCRSRTSASTCECNTRTGTCECQSRGTACECHGRIKPCTCVSRTLAYTCICNDRTGTCDCQVRTYADRCAGVVWCDCFSRTGSCTCNTRTACDCQSRTYASTCYCNYRTGTCNCVSRTYTSTCTCNGRCACNAENRFE